MSVHGIERSRVTMSDARNQRSLERLENWYVRLDSNEIISYSIHNKSMAVNVFCEKLFFLVA